MPLKENDDETGSNSTTIPTPVPEICFLQDHAFIKPILFHIPIPWMVG